MTITVKSSAFEEGGAIPEKYTRDGDDMSPPLIWSGIPKGVKSIALICDDPDAPKGSWAHWIVYNIPPEVNEFSENVPMKVELGDGTIQGSNDFHTIGYGGPCPPSGTHRYYFRVYALDTILKNQPIMTRTDLLKKMVSHVLAQGQLMGTYKRK